MRLIKNIIHKIRTKIAFQELKKSVESEAFLKVAIYQLSQLMDDYDTSNITVSFNSDDKNGKRVKIKAIVTAEYIRPEPHKED